MEMYNDKTLIGYTLYTLLYTGRSKKLKIMIKSSIEKLADTIGFEIGTSDDITQAKLINGLCKGLNNSIPQKSDLEMQLCYIAEKLDEKTEKVLVHLVEFIKLKNEK